MKRNNENDVRVPFFPQSDALEHNIFQIALSGNRSGAVLSEDIRSIMDNIQKLNPDWNYHLFDDACAESFIKESYGGEVLRRYLMIDSHYGAARADFLRYLLLYKFGGVYLDIKCTCTIPLEKASGNSPALFVFDDEIDDHPELPEVNGRFFFNGFIVTGSGNPIMRALIAEILNRIDSYNPYVDGVGWGGTVSLAGPVMYSRVIDRFRQADSSCVVVTTSKRFGYDNIYLRKGNKSRTYQKRNGMYDYRKQLRPVVRNTSGLLYLANSIVLYLMSFYRKMLR